MCEPSATKHKEVGGWVYRGIKGSIVTLVEHQQCLILRQLQKVACLDQSSKSLDSDTKSQFPVVCLGKGIMHLKLTHLLIQSSPVQFYSMGIRGSLSSFKEMRWLWQQKQFLQSLREEKKMTPQGQMLKRWQFNVQKGGIVSEEYRKATTRGISYCPPRGLCFHRESLFRDLAHLL